jgi:hypothetical protein
MSHQKKLVGAESRLGIFNAITVQLGTLVEDSPNNRHQMIASNMHSSSLLGWKEVGPHVDQRCRSIDSLQFFFDLTHLLKTTLLRQFQIDNHAIEFLAYTFINFSVVVHIDNHAHEFSTAGNIFTKLAYVVCSLYRDHV